MYSWLAVLETMWGDRAGRAPRLFQINPHNFSGRRLYRLTGETPGALWCTNCCRELVTGPNHHGTPDAGWLAENLARWGDWEGGCILVCGNIAQSTFRRLAAPPPCRTVFLPHPAARSWTTTALTRAGRLIREGRHSLWLRLEAGGRLAAYKLPEGWYAARVL